MGLRLKRLKSDEDLSLFQQVTSTYVDVSLPLNYLSKGKVIALFSKTSGKKIMHGGFVISHKALRSVMQIPQEDKLNVEEKFTKRINHSFEINGLWIDKKTTHGALAMAVWLRLAFEVFRMALKGKCYFIYSYDASKKHLAKLYSIFRPVQIYAGRVTMLEGMSDEGVEVIESGSLKNLLCAMVTRPEFYIKRIFRPSKGLL